MPYDPEKHHRRSIRLKGYDYAEPGAYFVTICVQGWRSLFGDVVDGIMCMNDAGRMIVAAWQSTLDRFPHITADVFVVMPNHFHVAIIIGYQSVGATLVVAPDVDVPNRVQQNRAGTSPAPTEGCASKNVTLGDVIGAFKSLTTREYINGVRELGWSPFDRRLWQRNYWEHIIRTPESHVRIEDYIINNPARWLADSLHPSALQKSSGRKA